jgi:hypothetical protein
MALDFTYYGSVDEAESYFAMRLHEYAWREAEPADKPKALYAATQIIDNLNFKGDRHTVWLLKQSLTPLWATPGDTFESTILCEQRKAQIRAAEEQQPLEFPRGSDTDVPAAILRACYEIAYSLLDGKDPEMELENLEVTAHGYGEVRTHYERGQVPIEHLLNMVPNAVAWNLLRPFLRDGDAVRLSRVC